MNGNFMLNQVPCSDVLRDSATGSTTLYTPTATELRELLVTYFN